MFVMLNVFVYEVIGSIVVSYFACLHAFGVQLLDLYRRVVPNQKGQSPRGRGGEIRFYER